ncbi:iron-sulfur cluster assembly protein NAR1 KNAG_0F00750 [Huiozyma naganishii CBS 8797]|uniref:Cytosolic Fe-S cluster assembly factor NAR1 n=1 Tax=Huiozyma naganishii (strain ATCC MYA-139 / BCRC 22969 / CBS 8797 / KCTC 17520 / NBRC 10181 / NCYC 3082 / Yp74L-3) TaxID=1071383 RepID=J7S733_HUIN7|nr:hypothetical protein KNAG_0F00750 [Kazachstania naganishii CBS 8797]CCK70744.1 hypothetical protein KNAG_0F00750 [Kazachstania naganishii CBS 8797]
MSTLLSEEDLNDFISPELACTKTTEVTHEPSGVDPNGEYVVEKESEAVSKVSITLSDCLACSGCITSSEEIMLQRQSHDVFLKRDTSRPLAVSIAPQCRVSLATHYGMTVQEFDLCLINVFQQRFGAQYVVGIEYGRIISLHRTIEAVRQWKAQQEGAAPCLSAIDPGFTIYTEKTKNELVPLLVNVKSPQQTTGHLLKAATGPELYHLTIQAVFDKKLEASRTECEAEVDCVITPRELLSLFAETDTDFVQFRTQETSLYTAACPPTLSAEISWSSNEGNSSGGYAYQYIRAQQQLYPGSCILELPGRNKYIREFRLVTDPHAGGATLASATELSGFRNIQNMVRHLSQRAHPHPQRRVQSLRKRRVNAITTSPSSSSSSFARPYETDFIEVNASPGGAINGGGLVNDAQSRRQREELTAQFERRYHAELSSVDPLDSRLAVPATPPLHYEFLQLDPQQQQQQRDLVTVGNTW